MQTPNLSPSERDTLRLIAEAEPGPYDWVAVQRLKGFGLVEERGASLTLHLTQDGRQMLRTLAEGL
jgi:hypothetical protein